MKILSSLDFLYGQPITLNYDGKSRNVHSACGGILSIFCILLFGLNAYLEVSSIYTEDNVKLLKHHSTLPLDEQINLKDYDDSFDLLFLISSDINYGQLEADNEYFSVKVYEK